MRPVHGPTRDDLARLIRRDYEQAVRAADRVVSPTMYMAAVQWMEALTVRRIELARSLVPMLRGGRP